MSIIYTDPHLLHISYISLNNRVYIFDIIRNTHNNTQVQKIFKTKCGKYKYKLYDEDGRLRCDVMTKFNDVILARIDKITRTKSFKKKEELNLATYLRNNPKRA